MKVAVFSAHAFERPHLVKANNNRFELRMLDVRLTAESAALADGCDAASLFTSDNASAPVLELLHRIGVRNLALRTAGFNHVDLVRAKALGIRVARVPAYSPYAIAEHAVALMLALNRKLINAHNRIRELNFSLDGLTGFDMNGKTVGIVGTGKIGAVLAKIMHGFGCRILAYDLFPNQELTHQYGATYTDFKTLCAESDIISLQIPLNDETRYMIDSETISWMKPGVMLINTSRGALVRTKAVIAALKTGHIGSFGLDVYEEEEGLFFEDHSDDILLDDVIARLMTFKNVIITSHQAFLTDTALSNIANTTLYNISCFASGLPCQHEL